MWKWVASFRSLFLLNVNVIISYSWKWIEFVHVIELQRLSTKWSHLFLRFNTLILYFVLPYSRCNAFVDKLWSTSKCVARFAPSSFQLLEFFWFVVTWRDMHSGVLVKMRHQRHHCAIFY
jgi:hypothetical protein